MDDFYDDDDYFGDDQDDDQVDDEPTGTAALLCHSTTTGVHITLFDTVDDAMRAAGQPCGYGGTNGSYEACVGRHDVATRDDRGVLRTIDATDDVLAYALRVQRREEEQRRIRERNARSALNLRAREQAREAMSDRS